mgnify:CR=1 FL=1
MEFYVDQKTNELMVVTDKNEEVKTALQNGEIQKLEANTVDAAKEKHVPDVKRENDVLKVQVGSVLHPMTPEHFIQAIYVETEDGKIYKKEFQVTEEPKAEFKIPTSEHGTVYAYCNLHGLWKNEF